MHLYWKNTSKATIWIVRPFPTLFLNMGHWGVPNIFWTEDVSALLANKITIFYPSSIRAFSKFLPSIFRSLSRPKKCCCFLKTSDQKLISTKSQKERTTFIAKLLIWCHWETISCPLPLEVGQINLVFFQNLWPETNSEKSQQEGSRFKKKLLWYVANKEHYSVLQPPSLSLWK